MTKAQQMLATAGFPDTKQGRASFHKQYPTPESFFKVYGNIHGDVLKPTGPNYTVDNVATTTPRMDEGESMYKRGGPVMYGDGTKVYSTSNQNTSQVGNNYQNTYQTASTNIDPNGNTSQQFIRQTNNPNQTPYVRYFNDAALGSEMHIAGANGNNMFFTPDPMMDNFLKTRSNYMSGAMTGEQMKRNGGLVNMYADGDTVGGEDEEIPKGYKKGKRGYYDPIEGATTQFEGAKDYYRGWFNSPIYKQIIQKQADALYGDNTTKKTKFIDRTINANINNWKYFTGNPYLRENLNKDYHIFGESGTEGLGSQATLDAGFVRNNPTLANSLYTHELAHLQGMEPFATSYDRTHVKELTPKFNPAVHKGAGVYDENGVWQDMSHVASPEDMHFVYTEPDEVRTEIHAVRQLAKQAGVYDPYTEPFTKEHLDKIEKLFIEGGPDGINFNQLGRLRKHFPDENVIDMMNTISQNKGQSGDNMQMARHGGSVMYGSGGKLPQGVLRSRLESHMSPSQAQSYINSYNVGGMINNFPDPPPDDKDYAAFGGYQNYIDVLAHGPNYDRFGTIKGITPKPGSYAYYKDRLENTKIKTANPHKGVKDAKINMHTITGSCESGNCYEFADGGTVDALQLMGMPTPPMYGAGGPADDLFSMTYGNPNRYFETKQEGDKYFVQQKGEFPLSNKQFKTWNSPSSTFSSPNQLNEWRSIGVNEYNKLNSQAVDGRIGYQRYAQGGHINHYIPSYNFGHVQSKNNTYMHGYGNGGPVGMYGFGSTIKDLGYGMADMSLGTIGGLTGIQSMQDIVDEDQYSNDKFDDVTNFAGKLGSAVVKNIPGVGQVVGAVGGGVGALANTAFRIDEKNYDPSQHTSKLDKIGNFIGKAGDMASMFTNPASAASSLSKGAKTAMNIGKIAGLGATAVNAGRDIANSQGGTYDPTNLLNLGMGVARSGFFGGNTNTSGNFSNTKGAVDYTPTMDTPLYAAMGGAVNAPNMMKYDNGSSVSNTDNLSPKDQYNLFLKAKPVTKYYSPAMPPHPKDGSMDPRGTVVGTIDPQTGKPIKINIEGKEGNWKLPNKTNFVTTKKDTEKIVAFNTNNDGIAQASAMANIAYDKERKDAKQRTMMANGGMVGQYGYGGGVKMYARGSGIPPIDSSMSGAPNYNNYNLGPIMGEGFYNPEATFNEYQGLENVSNNNYFDLASGEQMLPIIPRSAQMLPTSSIDDLNVTPDARIPLTPPFYNTRDEDYDYTTPKSAKEIPTSSMSNLNVTRDKRVPLTNPMLLPGEAYDKKPSWFNKNKDVASKAIMYSPGIYNMLRSLGKPFKMDADKYKVKGDVSPYEEEYVADYRPYNAAVANLNRMPGSGNLAARTNLFNAMQQQQDDARYKISLGNAQRKMSTDQIRLGRDAQNANIDMQIDQLNEQNRAAGRNMFGQGLSDMSNIAQFERVNAMTGNALGSIMQHYTMLPDGTMIPKVPGTYNIPGATPTTSSTMNRTGYLVPAGIGLRANNRPFPNFKTINPDEFNLFNR